MFLLKRKLKKLQKTIRARDEFKEQLLNNLLSEFDEQLDSTKVECSHRFKFATAGLVSFVIFFTMGTGVYAYESPEVIDGHPLHFVKSSIEYVEKGIARSPEDRATYHMKMMERRLREGEKQLPLSSEKVPFSLEAAADQFERSIEVIEERIEDEEERERIIEMLSIRNARYLELHSRVVDSEPGSTESDVQGSDENLEGHKLRQRVEGHDFSDQEKSRLFDPRRHAR
jgi:hypothetical protein